MKIIYAIIISLLLSIPTIGQFSNDLKRDHIWLFGYDSGYGFPYGVSALDFNESLFDIYEENSPMNFSETNASFCDNEGNLLCYTNGIYIANANHEPMENGDGLNPGPCTEQWKEHGLILPQGALFLPYPEHDSLIILLHGYKEFNPFFIAITSLYFSIININENNGLGIVSSKNIEIISDTLDYGKITATRHGNGRDWWVVLPEYDSNRIYVLLISPKGVNLFTIQEIGTPIESGLGQAVFSPDGSKYVRVNLVGGSGVADLLDIYDFDRCTGLFSNHRHIIYSDSALAAGVAISPNSRFLYVPHMNYVFQFDLHTSDIHASMDTVAIYDGYKPDAVPLSTLFFLAQIAPDNKIYINAPNSVNVLHVIHNPNEKGDACNMEQHGILLPTLNAFSMPNFPNYRLGPIDGSPCDTLGIDNLPIAGFRYEKDTIDSLKVSFTSLSWFEPKSWEWSFGDTQKSFEENPFHTFPDYGVYNVCLTVSNDFGENIYCKEINLHLTPTKEMEHSLLDFRVFPNPASSQITLMSSAALTKKSQFRLFNQLGIEVYHQWLQNGQKVYHFSLDKLPDSIYFYSIFQMGRKLKEGKLIIQN